VHGGDPRSAMPLRKPWSESSNHRSPGTRHLSSEDHTSAGRTSQRSLSKWGSHASRLRLQEHTLSTPVYIARLHVTRQHDRLKILHLCAPWQHGAPPCGTLTSVWTTISYFASYMCIVSVLCQTIAAFPRFLIRNLPCISRITLP